MPILIQYKMKNGTFTISLDFELHWGVFDKIDIKNKTTYFDNTIIIIPKILELFSKHNIEATWATVGLLFNSNIDNLKSNKPINIPLYDNSKLSAYNYINKNFQQKFSKYLFAPNLIDFIKKTKGQEIATHTYSHYYCLEKGQNINNFNEDLQKCNELAKQKGITFKSIVLPRNQYNVKYNKICYKNGIRILRSNPNIWFWNTMTPETLQKKIFRTLDCYIPLFKSYYSFNKIVIKKNQPILLPASRFFRPVSKYHFLNKIRIKRIKKEMTNAAKKNMFYHLWWHPHNYGNKPQNALLELEEILLHFKKLKEKYNMNSMNMDNIYETYFGNSQK